MRERVNKWATKEQNLLWVNNAFVAAGKLHEKLDSWIAALKDKDVPWSYQKLLEPELRTLGAVGFIC